MVVGYVGDDQCWEAKMPKVSPRGGGEAMRPTFVEVGDVPELFCDTITVERSGEMVRFCMGRALTPANGNPKAKLTYMVHMPTGAFMEALRRIAADFLKKPDGH